jgi:MoaA/NifB/PqqE/SkfB family radical SAM enzyme
MVWANVGLGERRDFFHFGNLKPQKMINLLKKVFSKQKPELSYFPLTYYVDVSTICNLKCPHCFQSAFNQDIHIQRQFMKYEDFLKILNKIKDYALILHLYTWGESLLNPDICKMIRAANDNGIRSRISSHMSIKMDDKFIGELVDSGLHRLTCSIDGPTQEIYEKYRVGGDLEQILNNVKKILLERKKRGLKYPLMIYRMIIFDWNYEYLDQARSLAEEIGFDSFVAHPGRNTVGGQEVIWDMENKQWVPEVGRRPEIDFDKVPDEEISKAEHPCHWLFNNMVITANGKSLACCTIPELAAVEELSLVKHSLSEVWNSQGYIDSRRFSLGLSQDRGVVMSHCEKCSML